MGKDADLVIWSGHPLSTYSRVETTFIEGEVYFDRQRDLTLREELKRTKEALLEQERAEEKRNRDLDKKRRGRDVPERVRPAAGGEVR